jgi:magnesium transporter
MLHKFLAFPIIDRERRITGVVDVSLFNEEVFGIPKTESGDELFQAIGFHISQPRLTSPLEIFRFRFPWLLVTISVGIICAFLARVHRGKICYANIKLCYFRPFPPGPFCSSVRNVKKTPRNNSKSD